MLLDLFGPTITQGNPPAPIPEAWLEDLFRYHLEYLARPPGMVLTCTKEPLDGGVPLSFWAMAKDGCRPEEFPRIFAYYLHTYVLRLLWSGDTSLTGDTARERLRAKKDGLLKLARGKKPIEGAPFFANRQNVIDLAPAAKQLGYWFGVPDILGDHVLQTYPTNIWIKLGGPFLGSIEHVPGSKRGHYPTLRYSLDFGFVDPEMAFVDELTPDELIWNASPVAVPAREMKA